MKCVKSEIIYCSIKDVHLSYVFFLHSLGARLKRRMRSMNMTFESAVARSEISGSFSNKSIAKIGGA